MTAGPAPDQISREDALSTLESWVSSASLRRHCLAVEAAMRAQARERGGDAALWGICGLLHDLDYERYPDPESGHPRLEMSELERLGSPTDLIRTIRSPIDCLRIPRVS